MNLSGPHRKWKFASTGSKGQVYKLRLVHVNPFFLFLIFKVNGCCHNLRYAKRWCHVTGGGSSGFGNPADGVSKNHAICQGSVDFFCKKTIFTFTFRWDTYLSPPSISIFQFIFFKDLAVSCSRWDCWLLGARSKINNAEECSYSFYEVCNWRSHSFRLSDEFGTWKVPGLNIKLLELIIGVDSNR